MIHIPVCLCRTEQCDKKRGASPAALADDAARLEAAANAGDGETVRAAHGAMLERYEAALQAIRAVIGADARPDDSSPGGEEEILEFLPDAD